MSTLDRGDDWNATVSQEPGTTSTYTMDTAGTFLDRNISLTVNANGYHVVDKTADGLCPQLPDEETLDKFLRQDGSWSSVKDNIRVELTQAEYNALTPEEQLNGTIYFVKDMQHGHTSGTSITMSDNADGGVDISINDLTRTLATQSDVAEIKAYIESLENKTEVQY